MVLVQRCSTALVFRIRAISRLILLESEYLDPAIVIVIKEYPRLGCKVIHE
jgi:hypothetical protein